MSMSNYQTIRHIPLWTFGDYQWTEFIHNRTHTCPLKTQWIHFDEYLLTFIGLILSNIVTLRTHIIEVRYHDDYGLFRCHMMNLCLTNLFLIPFVFNTCK
jgi:hypothetical protein